jgi:chitodextrinase
MAKYLGRLVLVSAVLAVLGIGINNAYAAPVIVPVLNGTLVDTLTQQPITDMIGPMSWSGSTITATGPYGAVSVNPQQFPNFQMYGLPAGTYNLVFKLQGHVINYSFTVTANSQYNHSSLLVPVPIIKASAGTGGTISSLGAYLIPKGGSQTYTIKANTGYVINQVLVDGKAVSLPTAPVNSYSYTFTNVTGAHTITVGFVKPPVIVSVLNGELVEASNPNIPITALTGPMSWNPSPAATGPSGPVSVNPQQFPNFQMYGLIAGTYNLVFHLEGHVINYSFTITANSQYNHSTLQVPVSLQPPTAPGNVTAQIASPTSITLNWNASTDIVAITGYRIIGNNSVTGGTAQTLGSTTNTSWTNTNLSPGATYNYRVIAYDQDGNSSLSSLVTVTLPTIIVSKLNGMLVEASNPNIPITALTGPMSWNPSPAATGPYGAISVNPQQFPNFQMYNLIAGTYNLVFHLEGHVINYSFTVTANSQYNHSTLQVPVSLQPPTAPGNVTAQIASPTSITLNWNASTDIVAITGYRIIGNNSVTGGTAQTLGSTTNTSWTNTNLSPGATYNYRVIAYDQDGNSSLSSLVTVTLPALQPPTITTQPTSLTVTAPATASFTVAATGIPSPSYQWEVSTNGGSSFAPISGATSGTLTITPTTTAMSGYEYECVASNGVPPAAISNAATLTVNPAIPSAPTLNTATSGDSSVALSWTAVTGATSYLVQYGTVSGVYQSLSVGNVTNFTVTGLINGTTYYFVVAAVNTSGTSPNSIVMSAVPAPTAIPLNYTYDDLNRMTNEQRAPTTTAYNYDEVSNITSEVTGALPNTTITLNSTPPSIPGNLAALAINSHQINLTWLASTDNAGVFGYIIYRNGYKVATTTLTTFSDLSLVSGTMYSYTIRAIDATGNLSGSSTTASLTTP